MTGPRREINFSVRQLLARDGSLRNRLRTAAMTLECLICYEKISLRACLPCGHNDICYLCLLRSRNAGQGKQCPLCKESYRVAVITGDPEATFDTYADRVERKQLPFDKYFKVSVDCEETLAEVSKLHHYSCRLCSQSFKTVNFLKKHLRESHGKYFCDVCMTHSTKFLAEEPMYSKAQLQAHMAETIATGGRSKPRHPLCEHCGTRCYDEDNLLEHARRSHEICPACMRRDIARLVVLANSDDLASHNALEHFICPFPECMQLKIVVFDSDLELRKHILNAHGDRLSRQDRSSLSRIDVMSGEVSRFVPTPSASAKRPHSQIIVMRPDPSNRNRPQKSSAPSKKRESARASKALNVEDFESDLPQAEYKKRNKAFIARLKDVLDEDTMTSFRNVSIRFRSKEMSCTEYFQAIRECVGGSKTDDIFEELVRLLPDRPSRLNLVRLYNRFHRYEDSESASGDRSHASNAGPGGVPANGGRLDSYEDLSAADLGYPTIAQHLSTPGDVGGASSSSGGTSTAWPALEGLQVSHAPAATASKPREEFPALPASSRSKAKQKVTVSRPVPVEGNGVHQARWGPPAGDADASAFPPDDREDKKGKRSLFSVGMNRRYR